MGVAHMLQCFTLKRPVRPGTGPNPYELVRQHEFVELGRVAIRETGLTP